MDCRDWRAPRSDNRTIVARSHKKRTGNKKGSNVHEKSLIRAAKEAEWKKLEEKGAVRILTRATAEKTKAQFGDRFIPSRFVVTRPGIEEIKARWCPLDLADSGATQSPTGRMLSCQNIVSNGWDLQLGDIRGAVLEADALDRKKGSLHSSLPPGIPGVLDGAVIPILGNIHAIGPLVSH